MLYFSRGNKVGEISTDDLRAGLYSTLDSLGKRNKVLIIPPDFTRFHSKAGLITEMVWEYFGKGVTDILPALGTHAAMTDSELSRMFGQVPHSLFRVHNWRNDIITLGEVPAEFIREVSGNQVDFPWPAQVNKLLVEGNFDLILSIGQVVPHEVIGMANYNKNVFVGTGGHEGINKSHFLGAAYGMERIMGRADNPVRKVLNYASEHFASHMPIVYLHTVIGKSVHSETAIKGFFAGDDSECFEKAAQLALEVNFELLDVPLSKVVVYLDPDEFKSTWLGNKSIYRTRMAMANDGELIILAPGLREFGEDKEIDRLIRKYGYRTTPEIMEMVKTNADLRENLSAAAHLIHGSSENRFKVTYCPGSLTRSELEGVNFGYADLNEMSQKYNPGKLKNGFNNLDGERIFFISNPALGLWASKNRFNTT